jgi:rRNA processing protein Krr1/Pno1
MEAPRSSVKEVVHLLAQGVLNKSVYKFMNPKAGERERKKD